MGADANGSDEGLLGGGGVTCYDPSTSPTYDVCDGDPLIGEVGRFGASHAANGWGAERLVDARLAGTRFAWLVFAPREGMRSEYPYRSDQR